MLRTLQNIFQEFVAINCVLKVNINKKILRFIVTNDTLFSCIYLDMIRYMYNLSTINH